MNGVLVISADGELVGQVRSALGSQFTVDHGQDGDKALTMLRKERRDLVFLDMGLPAWASGASPHKELLKPFWKLYPTMQIVVMAPQAMIRQAVKAVKAGASDYITYPTLPEEIKLVADGVRESVMIESELDYLRDRQWKSDPFDMVKTRSRDMGNVFRKIASVAPANTTVLLTGETGVGKGVMAKLIHRHSSRVDSQFISLHCGAIPENLVESELFGHERGAFTGAVRKKLGKFEIAHNGTIFLDEIGTISPAIQIKLLQVLQDGTFTRVGGDATIKTNLRVIAATNEDLKRMSDAGQFRKDLFYRLNVFPLEVPPLRRRPEDIPYFIDIFLDRLNQRNLKDIQGVHPLVLDALAGYDWPGNIRELENLIERAYILETSQVLTPDSFPAELFDELELTTHLQLDSSLPLAEARRQVIEDFERQYLKELLDRNRGVINTAAKEAGISTRQLHKVMVKYGIRKEDFKGK